MAAESNFELLDDYLANRLDSRGRSAFEEMMSRDPGLKSEFELQKEFINGIRKARIAELKAMLNSVPVPPLQPGNTALGTKIALWTVVAGALGVGAYYYLKDDAERIPTENVVPVPDPEEKINGEQPSPNSERNVDSAENDPVVDQSPVVATEPAATGEAPREKPEPIPPRKPADSTQVPSSEPRVEVFDPSEQQDGDADPLPENARPNAAEENRPALAVEIESNHRKYSFHYQFQDGGLTLYGPFESGLYEILEFFSDNQRTVFLLYDEKYYLLKDGGEKPKPLEAITDPALIRKLKEYRNR